MGWTEAKNVPVSTATAACMLPPLANASSSYVLDSCRGGGRKKGRRKKEETSWHPFRDSNGERLSCAIKEGGQEPSEE